MHPPQVAFTDFHQIIQSLAGLTERQQVTTLKFELFQAIERANDFRDQCADFEQRAAELTAETAARTQEHNAFAARLNAELVQATRELAGARNEQEKRLRTLRLDLVAAETHCDALDEMCRSLLVTIEQAAGAAAGTQAPGASGMSA